MPVLRCTVEVSERIIVAAKRRFQLILIKPSHYHDDGYVIRWWRAIIPSNSLAAVYSIAVDCAQRQVLGADVEIDITVIDETNARIKVPVLLARLVLIRKTTAALEKGSNLPVISPVSSCP